MTIQELYEWAKENDATDCDIVVRDIDGEYTHYFEPKKVNYTSYYEVELGD